MRSLAVRAVLFFTATILMAAIFAIPYLTIQPS